MLVDQEIRIKNKVLKRFYTDYLGYALESGVGSHLVSSDLTYLSQMGRHYA